MSEHEELLRTWKWFEQWEFNLHHKDQQVSGGNGPLLTCTVSLLKFLGVKH